MKFQDYSTQYQKFLKKLKQARLESNLTQKEVAKEIGKPQSFISKCESGERRVDIIEIQIFSSIYNKPLNFFLASDDFED